MRFAPESDDPENAGLAQAREALEPVKVKHPGISYSDLWILAAYCAIEHTGGPKIEFTGGRVDGVAEQAVKPGRLPGADHGCEETVDEEGRIKGWEKLCKHIRDDVFYRMGFDDKEIVALLCGGHVYGRCHTESSGFAGAWVENMTLFSNEYAADMIEDEWIAVTNDSKMPDGGAVPEEIRPAAGKWQYVDKTIYEEKAEAEAERKAAEAEDAPDFKPGRYKCVSQWVNCRQGADINSPIVGRFVEEQEMVILSVKKFTTAIRGRCERGGWVSIIGSGGKTLFESVGDLDKEAGTLVGKYRIGASDGVKPSPSPGAAPEEGATVLGRGMEVTVSAVQFGEAGEVYGEVDGKWISIFTGATGCQADLIVEGYNTKERVAIKGQSGHQMMLISDMVLLWDAEFKKHLEVYAEDEDALKADFGAAYKKLTELGCPFAMKN